MARQGGRAVKPGGTAGRLSIVLSGYCRSVRDAVRWVSETVWLLFMPDRLGRMLSLTEERLRELQQTRQVDWTPQNESGCLSAEDQFSDAVRILERVMRPGGTVELIRIIEQTPPVLYAWHQLVEVLVRKGGEEEMMGFLLQTLASYPPGWYPCGDVLHEVLWKVAESTDPRAVRFLIDQLGDPTAPPILRHTAFRNLARTGGAEGLHAVLAAKDHRPSAPPRALSEKELVLAAAFEAAFRFMDSTPTVCILKLPPGLEPFGFAGWEGTVTVERAGDGHPEGRSEGKDAWVVEFEPPRRNFAGRAIRKRHANEPVLWNHNRTEAKVLVTTSDATQSYHGYGCRLDEMHLRKLGNDWVVIDADTNWYAY